MQYLGTCSETNNVESAGREYFKTLDNCDTLRGECTKVQFRYPFIKIISNEAAADSINTDIELYLRKGFYTDTLYENYDSISTELFREYKLFLKDFPEYNIPWFLTRNIDVIHSSENLISLKFTSFTFMGGAHPNTATTLEVFDLTNGNL